MKALLQIAMCGLLAAGVALAQRGGGMGGGMHGGGGMGGGMHGGGMGGGMRGGGGFSGGGGFHGGSGFSGGGYRGGANPFTYSRGLNNVYRGGTGFGSPSLFRPGYGHGYYGYGRGYYGYRNYYGGYYGGYWPYYYGGYWPSWGFGLGYGWPGYYYDYPYYNSYPYYDGGYAAYGSSPNVTVVYPQTQSAGANTVYVDRANPVTHEYDQYGQEIQRQSGAAAGASSPIYLIAFKDHTIRAASSYWVDGNTLHFVTVQHEERQAALDSVDRELTAQVNRERRVTVNLPAPR